MVIAIWLWAAHGCGGGNWDCDEDEALSSFDGKCTKRETAGGGSSGGSGSGGAGSAGSGANGNADAGDGQNTGGNGNGSGDTAGQDDAGAAPVVDPRVEAHGRACMNETDCSPLAPVCSMRLGEDCPTAGCCISKGCDESDADACPVGWTCELITFAAATYCVPE